MRRFLQKSFPSSEVVAVGSARAGLDVLDQQRVDLVISDYRMPGMDGVEFLHECHARQPAASRMLITAFPQEAAAPAPGQVDVPVVTKPLNLDTFAGLVQDALAGHAGQPAPTRTAP